jgi:nicotinamide mononucleotide (NMN) deamidase PncC
MKELIAIAENIAARLIERRQTIAVAESSAGGLIYAKLLASQIRQRFSADWGLSETGATGPTGNRYGDAAGHCCMAVAGLEQSAITLETGSADRLANMHVFAATALDLLLQKLSR